MAGNSARRGARRSTGKKGASVGTGGHGRKALEGKGPTPKAEDRPYHAAYKRKQRVQSLVGQGSGAAGARQRLANPNLGVGATRDGASGGLGSDEFISGRNAVLEALRASVPANALFYATKLETDDRLAEIFALASDQGIETREISRPELDRKAGLTTHQGLVLIVTGYDYADAEDLLDIAAEANEAPLIVVLDHITDPHNLGAIARSAAAFGAHGLVIPQRRSASVTAAAWKTSAGALARIPVARVTNLNQTIERYRKAGLFAIGLDGGGDTPLRDLTFANDPLVIVIGAEGQGLGRLLRENCDAIVSIPIASSVESLNASVAAALTLSEVAHLRATE